MHDYKALLKFQPMATGSGVWGSGNRREGTDRKAAGRCTSGLTESHCLQRPHLGSRFTPLPSSHRTPQAPHAPLAMGAAPSAWL